MNPAAGSPHVAPLVSKLAALLDTGEGGGTLLSARAGNAYRLRSLRTTDAFISLVLMGRKRIHHGDDVCTVVPGQAAVIAAGLCIDVENIPAGDSGQYLAALIVVPQTVVGVARTLLGPVPPGEVADSRVSAPCFALPLASIANELESCLACCSAPTRARFDHALVGLLLRLHETGFSAVLQPTRPRLADSIGSLLASEPARDWRSADIERHFAVSGATLRRQLAAEQTSLRRILAETRLSRALHLLQSTRLPVKSVAARSGYQSVSSFVRRFHQRYGVEPSRVANAG